MEVIDNSKHIIGKIESDRRSKEQRLLLLKEKELKTYKKTLEQSYKQHSEEYTQEHESHLDHMKKRLKGAHELEKEQQLLAVESHNTQRVMQAVKEQLESLNKADKKRVVEHMLKHITDDRVKTYHVPKGVTIKGTKATRSDFSVVGVITKNEELEYTLADLMADKEVFIRSIMEKHA